MSKLAPLKVANINDQKFLPELEEKFRAMQGSLARYLFKHDHRAIGAKAGRSCLAENPCQVVLIPENEWTAGRPKMKPSRRGQPSRVDIIAGMFKDYLPEKDPGGDVADAIGLNLYYQRQQWLLAWKNQHPAGPARPAERTRNEKSQK